jgi:phosphoglycerate dehydrogenase-like enzyme
VHISLAPSLHLERASCSQPLSRSTPMLGVRHSVDIHRFGLRAAANARRVPAHCSTDVRRAPADLGALHSRRVKLWIPDEPGHDATGALPSGVELGLIPREGELPDAFLEAEFLVPRAGDRRIDAALADMPDLRVIQTLSAGVEHLLAIVPPGVTLCDARGSRDIAVAEWALAAILAAQKELPSLLEQQRKHDWQPRQTGELAGSTIMILGYGSIGAAVASRLEPFEVELIRVARHARSGVHSVDALDALLPLADIVVVLLPLTAETEQLLDGDALARMRHGALLVNAARGGVVDYQALRELLQSRRLRAALDVTDPEPLPETDPLWDAPGVLITPHLAGDTAAAERRAFAFVGEQVHRYVEHRPLQNVVEGGY